MALLMPIRWGHFQKNPKGARFKHFVRGSDETGKAMLSSGKLKRRLKSLQGQSIRAWGKGHDRLEETSVLGWEPQCQVSMALTRAVSGPGAGRGRSDTSPTGVSLPGSMCYPRPCRRERPGRLAGEASGNGLEWGR